MSSVRYNSTSATYLPYSEWIFINFKIHDTKNKRAKIRRFTLQIRDKITYLFKGIKHNFRFKTRSDEITDLNKERSHNQHLRSLF